VQFRFEPIDVLKVQRHFVSVEHQNQNSCLVFAMAQNPAFKGKHVID
jgi:hypothetical protein